MKIAVISDNGNVSASFKNFSSLEIFEIEEKNIVQRISLAASSTSAEDVAMVCKKSGIDAVMVGAIDGNNRLPFVMFKIAILAGMSGDSEGALLRYLENPQGGCDHDQTQTTHDCTTCDVEGCEHRAS